MPEAALFKLPKSSPTNRAAHATPQKEYDVVDVVGEYPWTINDNASAGREIVPRIILTEYQITTGALQNGLVYWSKFGPETLGDGIVGLGRDALGKPPAARDAGPSPYDGLYQADPTNFSYEFPFFGTYNHEISNEWKDDVSLAKAYTNVKSLVGTTGGVFEALSKHAMTIAGSIYPNVGAETPQVWEGTTDASYSFQFDLLNTISHEDARRNWELCFLLGHQTMHHRRNLMLSYPPCIYEVEIPGVRHCPAAFISNFKVKDMGHKRYIDGTQYPDAYRVSISINEMLPESRNIYKGVDENDTVTAIIDTQSVEEIADEIRDAAIRSAKAASKALDKGLEAINLSNAV